MLGSTGNPILNSRVIPTESLDDPIYLSDNPVYSPIKTPISSESLSEMELQQSIGEKRLPVFESLFNKVNE